MSGHTIDFDKEEMKKINIFKSVNELSSISEAVRKMVRIGYDKSKIKKQIDKT